jgi:hypothetical protein
MTTSYKLSSTFTKPIISAVVAYGATYLISPQQVNNAVVVAGMELSVPMFNAAVSAGSCLALNTVSEWVLPMVMSKEMVLNNKLILMPLTAGAIGVGLATIFRQDFVAATGYGEVFVLHAGSEAVSTYVQPIIAQYLPK